MTKNPFFNQQKNMTYQSKHTKILNPENGYNIVAKEYTKYHKHLDSFYNFEVERFIPRNFSDYTIIDLWAWDGRLFKYFENIAYTKYTACDIAWNLLEKHPENNKVEKIICDLEKELPFNDESFDLATSFFVIEHIENINIFLWEIYRILKKGWRCLISYFPQRREFTREKKQDKFKIQMYHHKLDEIKEKAEYQFFKFQVIETYDFKNIESWKLIILDK